jgi:hypothetical protein
MVQRHRALVSCLCPVLPRHLRNAYSLVGAHHVIRLADSEYATLKGKAGFHAVIREPFSDEKSRIATSLMLASVRQKCALRTVPYSNFKPSWHLTAIFTMSEHPRSEVRT